MLKGTTKISVDMVQGIREYYATGATMKDCAIKFNTSEFTVKRVLYNKGKHYDPNYTPIVRDRFGNNRDLTNI